MTQMSLITTRIHSNTACHAFLSRAIANFEAACNRVAKIVHLNCPTAPLPTINDAVSACIDGDSALMAEFFSADSNEEFIREVAAVVASTFERDRTDYEPTQAHVGRVVGVNLAASAYRLLSLADKLSIVRSLCKSDAIALCERKVKARAQYDRESLGSVAVPLFMTPTERAANRGLNWREQSRADKKRKAKVA